MPIGILNNIPSLEAENQLTLTSTALSNTLEQLSSGSRINNGADDPAGLSIANGLQANISALTQSVSNANDGVGQLQLADGALAQVTNLLNTAVTLATESATGTVSNGQRTAIQSQYSSILAEINRIGTATTYNGQAVFQSGVEPNLNAANSVNNGTTAPLSLTTALTVGDATTITVAGNSFTYTAANGVATQANPNQEVGATAGVTAATSITSGTLTITAGGKNFSFTAGAGGTEAALVAAINANTDATGAQAFLDSAGHLNIVDPNNNSDIQVTATGTGAASVLGALGAFSNPTVNVTNPNQQLGSVAGLTAATVITSGDVLTIGAGAHAETFTASAASTVGALITAINSDTTGGNITVGGTSNGVRAFLDSAGHLNITDPGNNNNLSITAGNAQTTTDVGTFSAAPEVVAPTVQNLINAINSSANTTGTQAALVGGQLQITDPLDRGSLAATTDDTALGAPVSGAPTSFLNPNTSTSTTNANSLVGSSTGLTLTTALTNGDITSFTVGGKSFTFTAGATSTVGDLINAINTPGTSDPAGLSAYLNSAGSLVVVDPNDNGNITTGTTNTETVLGTFSNPQLTTATTTNIFLSDATSIGSSQIAVNIGGLTTTGIINGTGGNAVDLATTDLNTQTDAQTALIAISSAISNIASVRGTLGASVNRLTAASNVINSQVQNLTSAENTITAADIPSAVANLTKYSILEQTGISALAQANQQQQLVLKLLQ